jgi:hypothetical protein
MIWRCYYVKRGTHVHCRLFCGPQEGALGLIGLLAMRPHEFTEFTTFRKVIAMNFRHEIKADGSLDGDFWDVPFGKIL